MSNGGVQIYVQNFLSCSNNIWGLYEGSPQIQTLGPDPGNWINKLATDKRYTGILKLCDNTVKDLYGIVCGQGTESGVDVANHADIKISGIFGDAAVSGNRVFSVKGGSKLVVSGAVVGSGTDFGGTDFLADDWCDQSYNGSVPDITNCVHGSGRKLIVVYRLFATKVLRNKATSTVKWWACAVLTVYWWFKWIIRKIHGKKVGENGF